MRDWRVSSGRGATGTRRSINKAGGNCERERVKFETGFSLAVSCYPCRYLGESFRMLPEERHLAFHLQIRLGRKKRGILQRWLHFKRTRLSPLPSDCFHFGCSFLAAVLAPPRAVCASSSLGGGSSLSSSRGPRHQFIVRRLDSCQSTIARAFVVLIDFLQALLQVERLHCSMLY